MIESINIRPTVHILSKFKFFPYQQQYALAEFVDNSIQSFLDNEDKIKSVDGADAQIEITIDFDRANDILIIKDNAAGIKEEDYERAFLAGEDPPDPKGLSEFGMGMKVAASWYAKNWTVATTTIGEKEKRTVEWDMNQLLDDLPVNTSYDADRDEHGTTVTLRNLNRWPRPGNYGPIRNHLASIYQWFLKRGQLKLTCLGRSLSAHELPEILYGPHRNKSKAPQEEWKVWKKNIALKLKSGISVTGFVAVANTGTTLRKPGYGFTLFRKKRAVKTGDKPAIIFGNTNTAGVYQRLFGELHLNSVGVSFSKNDFDWDEDTEQSVWQELATELEKKPMELISHANADYSLIRPTTPPEQEQGSDSEQESYPEQESNSEQGSNSEQEPEIDVQPRLLVIDASREELLDPEQPIVYFHQLPELTENRVIKVGRTTVRELNNRIKDPQRYFVEDVECLGVIPLNTPQEALNKEKELLDRFGRANANRHQCELIWDTDDVRRYIKEECKDPKFYTEASRRSD